MHDDVVARLQNWIIQEIQERDYGVDRPLTVRDLYEQVAPYHAVRSRLQVGLNADYEHALLRLLAAEDGLITVETEDVRERLRRELEEAYPDVAIVRRFPDAPVRISPLSRAASPVAPPPVSDDGMPRQETTTPEPDPPVPTQEEPLAPPVSTEEEPLAPPAGADCSLCGKGLPVGCDVLFCPFCGRDQRLRQCRQCQELVERDWRYCVRCGHETDA